MRKVISLVTMAALMFFLPGCGAKRRDTNSLMVWHVGPESQARTIVEISRGFTEKTGIKVSCQAVSWSDAHTKYLISIAGELAPDIGSMGLTWGMEFGELGALVDMKEDFSQDVTALEEKMFPGILESTRVGKRSTAYLSIFPNT